MPHLAHTELSSQSIPAFPPPAPTSIKDDTKLLCKRLGKILLATKDENGYMSGYANGNAGCIDEPRLPTANKRRAYFASAKNRRRITFGPEVRLSHLTTQIES